MVAYIQHGFSDQKVLFDVIGKINHFTIFTIHINHFTHFVGFILNQVSLRCKKLFEIRLQSKYSMRMLID